MHLHWVSLTKCHGEIKQEAQRATYRAPEYNVPPFWQIGQGSNFFFYSTAWKTQTRKRTLGWGGHLVFQISPKNTNFVEDVEILLSVKFRWITFSGFRGKVENVSTNQRLRRPSCFSDRPEKHKLGRWPCDLASCQVSLNSVRRFQRRSPKMSQPIRGRGRHFVFPLGPKNTNLVEVVEILLPVKFRWILYSGFREEVKNVSANQRPGQPSCFSDRLEKRKPGILLPFKFRWFLFRGFRGEV